MFECYSDEEQSWHECKKAEICGANLPKDHYRADTEQDEYLDNWVAQYDLLCEPKWKIGVIGSCYFAGIISTIILVPWLADKYGRRWN